MTQKSNTPQELASTQRPRVLVTRALPEQGLARLRQVCEVFVWPEELPPARSELLGLVQGVQGILSLLTDRMDAEMMDAAGPALRVISNYAVGYDNIDLAAAAERGVTVGNTPDVLTDTTADLAFALLMAAARRVSEGDRYVRAGQWRTWGPLVLLGQDVAGATLGIIGYGRIGRAMARRGHGFDMRVLYHNTACLDDAFAAEIGAECSDLETVLRESDFLSLHAPLTPETHHLLNAGTLALMKPNAILINTARGGLVDSEALYHALKAGRLRAAALDVTEPEPLPVDHPLLSLDNLLVTPHIGSASEVTRSKMAEMATENILAGLSGNLLPYPVPSPARRPRPALS